ncbi:unnamed protein product [Rhodiola kirilowii]
MDQIGSGDKTRGPKPATVLDFRDGDGDGDENRFAGEDFDSACSTPFVSAPSSPTRGGGGAPSGYFFSAPASPVHYVLTSCSSYREKDKAAGEGFTDFEFSSRSEVSDSGGSGSMSSADELFLNGKIRPMKLSSHLQRAQALTPLLDLEEDDEATSGGADGDGEETVMMMRGRDIRMRNRSLHRKTRSLSPLRNSRCEEQIQVVNEGILSAEKQSDVEQPMEEAAMSGSASSSRSSSSGSRNSKKWIFLKDLLYRSKSEGRASTKEKFWSSISFSPGKEKKSSSSSSSFISSASKSEEKRSNAAEKDKQHQRQQQRLGNIKKGVGKPANGNVSKRRVPPSAHELHYTANRAQAEEMKKKTYLPYRQGLFGCLGFSSKGYGALHVFTKTLNPVSSR